MRRTEIERLLPGVFRRTLRPGGPLLAVLDVMEALHAPSEDVLARLDAFFDPRRAPDAFVPFLARWVDLERLLVEDPDEFAATASPAFPSGYGRLRELVAAAAYLSQWRGTRQGLVRFLEIATGAHGFEVDEHVAGPDGRLQPFHLRVRAPQAAAPYRALVRRIVELEKPAYVTYELAFGP